MASITNPMASGCLYCRPHVGDGKAVRRDRAVNSSRPCGKGWHLPPPGSHSGHAHTQLGGAPKAQAKDSIGTVARAREDDRSAVKMTQWPPAVL